MRAHRRVQIGLGLAVILSGSVAALALGQPAGRNFARCIQSVNEIRRMCETRCETECPSIAATDPSLLDACLHACHAACVELEQETRKLCKTIEEPYDPPMEP